MDKKTFVEECAFAKIVTNSDGEPCILVSGIVFQLKGQLGAAYTEFFVDVLRNSSPREMTGDAGKAANPERLYGYDRLKA